MKRGQRVTVRVDGEPDRAGRYVGRYKPSGPRDLRREHHVVCDDMGLVEAVRPPARVVPLLDPASDECPEHGHALRNGRCDACDGPWDDIEAMRWDD